MWFQPVPENVLAANLSLQTYEGRPVLAWWQGVINDEGLTTSGEYVVVDQHYRPVARLHGADGWVLALHEIAIRGARRLGDGEQERPRKPLALRRRPQRNAARLGGPGIQPEDREAPSQLGRARITSR